MEMYEPASDLSIAAEYCASIPGSAYVTARAIQYQFQQLFLHAFKSSLHGNCSSAGRFFVYFSMQLAVLSEMLLWWLQEVMIASRYTSRLLLKACEKQAKNPVVIEMEFLFAKWSGSN